ncbi:polysaccharide lyase 6 family protein [Agarivorans sp. Alg241-V36]|uniref:polysaccharide lyase 6 family protein n=1 Tax=Agarivorans sp. Alg241-V36 TaxID=2305992 RepID=UPI0013D719F6|nr:polysaccharide lyase 6 family protein [Agarivorans sp. Alg241-V36]
MYFKKYLPVVLGLIVVGCNSSSDSPATPLDPTEPADPPVIVDPPVDPEPSPNEPSFGLPEGVLTVPSISCDEVFSSTSALADAVSKEMAAGTTLCLADGEFSGDLQISFGGAGTAEQPIKIAAQNPGKAILKGGEVAINMGGTYTQLQGIVFEEVRYGSNLIATRFGTNDLCHNCRISEIAIIDAKAEDDYGILLHIYGKNVWLDHSIVSGKTVKNPMISFNRWVDDSWDEATKLAELAQGIVVYNNYIANRTPADNKMYAGSSDNDYEAIRTGLSFTHHYPGNSFIVRNVFERIQGEAEVISNKGSNNVIAYNTIRNSYGSLTNRHGNSNAIEHNFIIGEDYPLAGGIRIADDGHSVVNNYIEGARYQNTSHHGGIVLLGYDGAGDGDNGYQQVENVHVANNTIVDSVNSLNIDGGSKPQQPKQVYLANNLVDMAIGPVITQAERGMLPDSTVVGNIFHGQAFSDDDAVPLGTGGIEFVSANLSKGDDSLYRPTDSSPDLMAVSDYSKGDFADVSLDMDGQTRSATTTVGADQPLSSTVNLRPLSFADVGPSSYQLSKPKATMLEADIANPAFDDGLTGWTNSGAQQAEESASFSRKSSAKVSANSSLSQSITLSANTPYVLSAFVKGSYQLALGNLASKSGVVTGDKYQWVSTEFNSGSNTEATLSLSLPDTVTTSTELEDGNLGEFRSNSGSSDAWVQHEDSSGGLGDVGSSGDTAFSDSGSASSGSARIRFKSSESNHDFTATPGLSQTVANIPLNTDLQLSMYYCDNKGDNSLSTLHYGVKDSTGAIIAQAFAHVKDLDDAPQGDIKSCFKQVSLGFDSANNSSIEVFAFMQIDTASYTDAQIYAHEQFTDDEVEVRIDEFALTYAAAPSGESEAFFDDIRLMSRED